MTDRQDGSQRVVGVMTGTSIDGIDAALVRLDGRGQHRRAQVLRHISRPLGDLAQSLRDAAEQKPMPSGEMARIALAFGQLHAHVIAELLGEEPVDRIVVHGQTVFHVPPVSWQIINPAPIAVRFGVPVVSDLRQADLAQGGQGAPITPPADWVLYRDSRVSRAVVNLGGYCNMTILPRDDDSLTDVSARVRGFDVCACNQVLDAVARLALKKKYDNDGAAARSGQCDAAASAELLHILRQQRDAGRSLGTGDEAQSWVHNRLHSLKPADLAATAVRAIAHGIGETVHSSGVDEIIVAGGGARNRTLVEQIQGIADRAIRLSDEFGVPIEAREAAAIAILGAVDDGFSIFLPPSCSRS